MKTDYPRASIRLATTVWLLGAAIARLAAQDRPASPQSIGSAKQLFIDDSILDRTEDVSRIQNMPARFGGNPILRPEREWEGNCVAIINVMYDEDQSLWRMWYSARKISAEPPSHYSGLSGDPRSQKGSHKEEGKFTCYATSRDGIHWERPNLGLVEFKGSRNNNIIPVDRRISFLQWIVKDDHDENPDRRYKGGVRFNSGLFFSPDGIHPSDVVGRQVVHAARDENLTYIGWDDRIQRYLGYFRPNREPGQPHDDRIDPPAGISDARTIVAYFESADFIHWSKWGPALVPDGKDPADLQYYGMPAMKYEGYYLGFPWVFRTNQMTIESGFAYSYDGESYVRLENRPPFIPLGAHGAWDDCGVYTCQPVVRGGKLWFYYGGSNFGHSYPRFVAKRGGASFAVGLATLPLDGFVSLDAGPKSGLIVTKPLVFSGTRLVVNFEGSIKSAWAPGPNEASSLEVGLLDENGKLVDGGLSVPVTNTGIHQKVAWKNPGALEALSGKTIRLSFRIRNGKFYSFQFVN